MTTSELLPTLMPTVADMLSKEQRKAALEGLKNNVVHEYGLLAVEGDEERAEQDLSRHQRDQLTFERNTGELKLDSYAQSSTSPLLHPPHPPSHLLLPCFYPPAHLLPSSASCLQADRSREFGER